MFGRTKPGVDANFARWVFGTVIVTLLLIVIGAITRTSNSGMGCGTYWPSCNGQIVPEFANATVVIEFSHRMFALLVAAFIAVVTFLAWRSHRREPHIMRLVVLGIFLYLLQAVLGAITVALNNNWISVLLHLINSMLLLACYIVLLITVLNPDVEASAAEMSHLPAIELILTAALTFLVAIIGAAVAGNGAMKACVGWPLCNGEVWPATQGPLQALNMLHRLAAGGLGIMLILMLWQLRSVTTPAALKLRQALIAAFVLYVLQAGLGALVVLVDGKEVLFVLRFLHVAFAAATWSAMIVASTVAWLQQQEYMMKTSQEDRPAAPSVTISS